MFTNEKNIMQMSWLQTQVKIVKFELKKKKSRERENADQLCCQSMTSLNWDETSIQSSGSLATKYGRFFCLTY